jgi:hypothetical protein
VEHLLLVRLLRMFHILVDWSISFCAVRRSLHLPRYSLWRFLPCISVPSKTEVETTKGAVVNMESTYYNVVAPASYGGLSKFKPKGYTKKEVSCRLRDFGVLFVWPIKSCGTFASRKASPNVSHPCGLKYFLLRSTSFTTSTTLLPLTVSPLVMEDWVNLSRKVIRRKKSENGYSLRTRTRCINQLDEDSPGDAL